MRSLGKISSKYRLEVQTSNRRRVSVKAADESDGHHNESKISLKEAVDSFMFYVSTSSLEELTVATAEYVSEHKIDATYMQNFTEKLGAYCQSLSVTEDSTD